MKIQTLRYQLLALFALSVVSTIFFCCKDSLPDHIFSISSSTVEVSTISYYLTSLLAIAGFYIGPWITVVFFVFAVLYASIFARRDLILDQFGILFLTAAILGSLYFFFPQLIGRGLLYSLSQIPVWYIVIATMLTIGLSLVVVFRSSLRKNSQLMLNSFVTIATFVYEMFKKKNEDRPRNIVPKNNTFKNLNTTIMMSVSKILRGPNKNTGKTGDSFRINKPLVKAIAAPIVTNAGAFFQNEKSIEADDDIIIGKDEDLTGPIFKPLSAVNKNRNNDTFKVEDLVSCITVDKKRPKVNPDSQYFDEIISRIEEKLSEFNLDASIINILKGPVVDTFELELGPGVKVSKITSIHEDLSLTLCGIPIRIVYPMRGKTTVGIEVPRNPREVVYLDEVLNSQAFMELTQKLPIVMGKNAFGEISIIDLVKMPHMLVAGATGSGKSVFVNTLLVSLLVKMPPSKLKLILVDPKQLELALYAKLPHLIMPVVTDAKVASISLLWAVQEMERRYTILKELRVRNIDGFNEKVITASNEELMRIHPFYEDQEGEGYELPYIVIIIDEFADLMLTKVGKEIEGNVCRLAAKARAAGIHLIVATQRPSVDVITGLIKSNFPTRVSFKVASAVDSRTILNSMGGEKLLGNGDMLYKHGVEMMRLHSSYVDEAEIEILVEKIGEDAQHFNESVVSFLENGGEFSEIGSGSSFGDVGEDNLDALYQSAVEVVLEHNQASASFLQRRLRIGYNRAANLIDTLEMRGVIGPAQGSKPREVLAQ